MSKLPSTLLALVVGILCFPGEAVGQATTVPAKEVRRYTIEVAGVQVGTMTATRQLAAGGAEVICTLVSDVQVNFLLYHLKIYYHVTNRSRNGQLLLSTVEAHTNQGNFASRAEWKGDHYAIVANQYKHQYRATEMQPITYTVTDQFFGEPAGRNKAYAEYFGDFFSLSEQAPARYRAVRDGREDEYRYVNGELVTIIKKNPLKNFVIQLQP